MGFPSNANILRVKSLLFVQEFSNREVREERQENLFKLCALCGLCGSFLFSGSSGSRDCLKTLRYVMLSAVFQARNISKSAQGDML